MVKLEEEVIALENALANYDTSKKFNLALCSGSHLIFTFTQKFLQDQGFDVITVDFEEFTYVSHIAGVDSHQFVEHQLSGIQQACEQANNPVVYLRKFTDFMIDNYFPVKELIINGVCVPDKNNLNADNADNFNLNHSNKEKYIPIIVACDDDLSFHNRQLMTQVSFVGWKMLERCKPLHVLNDQNFAKNHQHYDELIAFYKNKSKMTP